MPATLNPLEGKEWQISTPPAPLKKIMILVPHKRGALVVTVVDQTNQSETKRKWSSNVLFFLRFPINLMNGFDGLGECV